MDFEVIINKAQENIFRREFQQQKNLPSSKERQEKKTKSIKNNPN